MSIAQPPAATPALPDRSTRLMLFGVFQIVLGCFCGLMGLMIAYAVELMLTPKLLPGMAIPTILPADAISARTLAPMVAFYLVLAAAFLCLGIGSIRARRWAWTLTVVLSWMWLIFGLLAFVFFLLFARPIISASVMSPLIEHWGKVELPEDVLAQALVTIRNSEMIAGAVIACVYILLPAVFLIFYQRESVRATCQRLDRKVPWTDRCPMPVLALSILQALGVLGMPAMMLYAPVMPLFGVFLSDAAGAAAILLIALALAYLAWGSYRLKMAAWWGMLLLVIAGTVNAAVTFSRTDLMEMYKKMQVPAAQLALMEKSGVIEMLPRWMPWICLVSGVLCLGYLLYVRRCFVRAGSADERG